MIKDEWLVLLLIEERVRLTRSDLIGILKARWAMSDDDVFSRAFTALGVLESSGFVERVPGTTKDAPVWEVTPRGVAQLVDGQ